MTSTRCLFRTLCAVLVVPAAFAWGWGEDGHIAVTATAIDLLPDDVPAFLKTPATRARLTYLSNEPDRWRNLDLAPMGQLNKQDHYFDVEHLALYELDPKQLPPYRYEFITAIELYKSRHPDKDYKYDQAKDKDHSQEFPGFAPYRICELYVQIKSSWRTLNTFEKYRSAVDEETLANARENVILHMGLLSHYVGDMAQPLHATEHHHGWVGENPKGYSTERGIHSLIDDGVIDAAHIDFKSIMKLEPKRRALDEKRLFEEVMGYVMETFAQMEPLYALEKRGGFKKESPAFNEGVQFIEQRMASGAVMLEALWESAARDAGIDEYRERSLQKKVK